MKKIESITYDGEAFFVTCEDGTVETRPVDLVTATMIKNAIIDYAETQTRIEHDAQLETGNIWTIKFWRFWCLEERTCFSETEALLWMYWESEYGNISTSGGSITYPDGTILEGRDMHEKIEAAGEFDRKA